MPNPPLALCPHPFGWGDHMADTVHGVQSRVHGSTALRFALPQDATGGGPWCLVGDPWWPEFGTLRRPLPYLADGPLSRSLRVWPPESGHRTDAVWAPSPSLFPG